MCTHLRQGRVNRKLENNRIGPKKMEVLSRRWYNALNLVTPRFRIVTKVSYSSLRLCNVRETTTRHQSKTKSLVPRVLFVNLLAPTDFCFCSNIIFPLKNFVIFCRDPIFSQKEGTRGRRVRHVARKESLSRDLGTDHVIRLPSLSMFVSSPLLNLLLQTFSLYTIMASKYLTHMLLINYFKRI